MDGRDPQRRGQVRFTGPGSTHQNHVVRLCHEPGSRQWFDTMRCQRRFTPVEAQQVTMDREAGDPEWIIEVTRLSIGLFGGDQPIQPDFGYHGLWLMA